jgi:lipopolysaccharide/colanic/teichoic acid biosynthesis glycosyltransferase
VVETVGERWMKTKRRMEAGRLSAGRVSTPRPPVVRAEPTRDPEPTDWDTFLPERAQTRAWRIGQRVKRGVDFVGAAVGLLVLLPLLAAVALLVRATSRGPVLYRSRYVGERGRGFVGYKFRSMVADADGMKASVAHLNHMKGPAFKVRDDPRVTRVGKLLRKLSLDELPQLWNVLRGDMSLVGPRPPLPEEYARFEEWHKRKLAVKPGITCLWQINGRSEICDFDEWARLDLQYIESWSLWADLRILVRTIPAVVRGRGAY